MASRSSRQRHLHSHCFSPRRASGRLHSRRRPPGAPRQPRSRRHYRHKRLSGTAADLPSRLRTEPVVAAHRTRPVTRPPRALTTRRWCPEAAAARADGARDSARRPGPTAGPPRGSRVPPLRRRAGLRGRPLAPRRCPTWLGAPQPPGAAGRSVTAARRRRSSRRQPYGVVERAELGFARKFPRTSGKGLGHLISAARANYECSSLSRQLVEAGSVPLAERSVPGVLSARDARSGVSPYGSASEHRVTYTEQ